jgi:hypothetical protein
LHYTNLRIIERRAPIRDLDLERPVPIQRKHLISRREQDQDAMTAQPKRSAIVYLGIIGLAAWLALYARHYVLAHPGSPVDFAADILWAVVVFAAIGLFFPVVSTWQATVWAFVIPALFELGQLYRAPWLDVIRGTSFGLVVFGTEFVMLDFACYAAGALLGMGVELFALD